MEGLPLAVASSSLSSSTMTTCTARTKSAKSTLLLALLASPLLASVVESRSWTVACPMSQRSHSDPHRTDASVPAPFDNVVVPGWVHPINSASTTTTTTTRKVSTTSSDVTMMTTAANENGTATSTEPTSDGDGVATTMTTMPFGNGDGDGDGSSGSASNVLLPPDAVLLEDFEFFTSSGESDHLGGWSFFGGDTGMGSGGMYAHRSSLTISDDDGGGGDRGSSATMYGLGEYALSLKFGPTSGGGGSNGKPGYWGGFMKLLPGASSSSSSALAALDVSKTTHLVFWIDPDAIPSLSGSKSSGSESAYSLGINLQEAAELSGNGGTTAMGDEFRYDCAVSARGPCAYAGGGWQPVSIPLSDFTDDNSYINAGDGTFNGKVRGVVVTVRSQVAEVITFRTDQWYFTDSPPDQFVPPAVPDDDEVDDDGQVEAEKTPSPTPAPTKVEKCPSGTHRYTLNMYDHWGDGWDNTYLTITPIDPMSGKSITSEPIYRGTLPDGHTGIDHLCLPTSSIASCYRVTFDGSSPWNHEILWELITSLPDGTDIKVAYASGELRDSGKSCLFDPKGGYSGYVSGCPDTCRDPQSPLAPEEGGGGNGLKTSTTSSAIITTTLSTTTSTAAMIAPSEQFSSVATTPTTTITTAETAPATVATTTTTTTKRKYVRTTPSTTVRPAASKPTLPPTTSSSSNNNSNIKSRPFGYFNYDRSDKTFGPDGWYALDVSGNQWDGESGIDSSNFCPDPSMAPNLDPTKPESWQSPIQISTFELWTGGNDDGAQDGGGGGSAIGATTACDATRQIRTKPGRFDTCNERTGIFVVTPTKARVIFGSSNRPNIDLPSGGAAVDAKYLEVSVPSLHRVEDSSGRRHRYDAEYTIVHPNNNKRKVIMISVLIDGSGSVDNPSFETLLGGWSKVDVCSPNFFSPDGRRRMDGKGKGLLRSVSAATEDDDDADADTEADAVFPPVAHRSLQNCDFDVYHRDLVPTAYYVEYEGSLPEPPCTPGVVWHVMSRPMMISASQLGRLKSIMTGSAGPCHGHPLRDGLGEDMVRPLQPSLERSTVECRRGNYALDCEPRRCTCSEELCTEDFLV